MAVSALRIGALTLACFLEGALVGWSFSATFPFPVTPPPSDLVRAMTEEERAGEMIYVKVEPRNILLRLVSDEEWERLRQGPQFAAFADWSTSPCRIVIPARSALLRSDPQMARAAWADPYMNEILVHEILHCARGGWHDDWNEVLKRRRDAATKVITLGSGR